MTTQHLNVPRNLRRSRRQADTEAALASAVELRELLAKKLEGAGWTVESLHDPQEYIRHFMVCAPDPGERG